jgi:hypothetical protein
METLLALALALAAS